MKKHLFALFSMPKTGVRSTDTRSPKKRVSDRWIMVCGVLLSLFGILMVYDSSVAIAMRDFSDQYYFVREQLKWLGLGSIVFVVCANISYRWWSRLAVPMLFVTLGLLMAVFIPGVGVRALGAHRWINVGFFILQPAELAKFSMVIYLSAWFARSEKKRFLSFLLLLGTVSGLVILEPDLGTSLIITTIALLLYFFSGAALRHFLFLIPCIAAAVIVLIIVAPYRAQRLMTFLDTEHDPQGSSYQIRQVLLGLGSGGWFGVGIGKSRQKYEYLPEANTDSIFAIIGEEVGFIGAAAVVGLYMFLVSRGFAIARRAPDAFGRLLALGISSWIGVQTLMNLGAMVALIPLTGIPLPFISYGGSSLIILLASLGILVNISRYRI